MNVTLTTEQVDEIARRVSARVAPLDVMWAKDAAGFLQMSEDQFYHWRKRWGVRSCGFGRYSLRALKAGLEREARNTFTAASRLAGAGRLGDRRSQGEGARANAGGGET